MKDELDKFLDRYNEQQHELSGWISEYRAARAEVERLKAEREKLKEYIEELENTLGLRNRSNPDLTIDEEIL